MEVSSGQDGDDKNADVQQQPTSHLTSPLLGISGGLRNKIYRETFVQDRSIKVTTTGVPEPPLLATCKQIRREGMDVFYGDNRFRISLPHYDSTICMLWLKKVRKMREVGDIHVSPACYGGQGPGINHREWENLIVWLKRYHEKTVRMRFNPPTQIPPGVLLDAVVIGGMFNILGSMEEKPWSEVESVLNEQRNILTRIDAGWSV